MFATIDREWYAVLLAGTVLCAVLVGLQIPW
jgi:predicted membrane-bound spermidine synthase